MESGWFFAGRMDSAGGNVLMCMEVNSQEMELGFGNGGCGDAHP